MSCGKFLLIQSVSSYNGELFSIRDIEIPFSLMFYLDNEMGISYLRSFLANLKNQPHESVREHESSKKHKQKETKVETETITFAAKKPYTRDPLGK